MATGGGDLLEYLKEYLKIKDNTIARISKELNVCSGTVRRWIELGNVPPQYTFDIYKLTNRPIDYSKYSIAEKDQFFTPRNIAIHCLEVFRKVVPDHEEYTFIEPSAGDGSFMKLLPEGKTIGLDIEPRIEGALQQDYLTWTPPEDVSAKYIVFGNPPFGLRGHLALNFINHSYPFADYVCFILPQLFESDGKGSPRKRVTPGYNLIYSEKLSAMFRSPDEESKDVKVNGVFQIWSKVSKNPEYELTTYSDDHVKVYSLSDGGTVATTRNKAMIGKCDIYLPSTCFGKENMRIYESFESLPGKKGYGVVFSKDRDELLELARSTDWSEASFLSTNSAYNLRSSIIHSKLLDRSSNNAPQ